MYIRNGIKITFRARKRSLLFGLLILLLTLTVTLGAGMWVCCLHLLAKCDASYTTIALIEYIGSDYNNEDASDESARNAAREMEAVDIGSLDGVELWELSEKTLISVENYERSTGELPYGEKAVFAASRFIAVSETEGDIRYSAYVNQVLYASDDIEGKLITINAGSTGFEPQRGEMYLIHADKMLGIGGYGSYTVSEFYNGCEELPYRIISDESEAAKDSIFCEYSHKYRLANGYARMEASADISSLEIFHQGTLYLKKGRFPQEGETATCVISGTTALSMGLDVGDSIDVTELVSQPADRFDMRLSDEGSVSLLIVGITNENSAYDGYVWASADVGNFVSPGFGYQLGRCVLDNETAADAVIRIEKMLPEQVHATLLDQGYAEMARPLKMLLSAAKAVTMAGICATLVVLFLFAYLFVGRQKETAYILSSLGTPEKGIRLWILSGAAVVAAIPAVIGGINGGVLFSCILNKALNVVKGLYSVDKRYSETTVGTAIDAMEVESLPVWVILAVCAAVFASAMFLCAVFLKEIYWAERPGKGKSYVRVPKGKTSVWGRGAARFALLSAKRGGWRSGVVIGVSLGLSMFVGILLGSVQNKQTQLDDIYKSSVEGYVVDTSGRSALGVGMPVNHVQDLWESGMLKNIYMSTDFPYWFPGEMPDFGSGWSASYRENAWFSEQPEITALNGLSAAPEFFYNKKWEVEWMKGWNESMFSDDRYLPFVFGRENGVTYPSLVSRHFLDERHLSLGDNADLWIKSDLSGGGYVMSPVRIQIVGVYSQNSSKNSIYVPLSFWCSSSLIDMYEEVVSDDFGSAKPSWMQDQDSEMLEIYLAVVRITSLSTCRFSLNSADNLDDFRDYLDEKGFSAVGKLKRNRTTILLKDKSFTEIIGNLERYMTFTDILLPAFMAVVGLIGLVISWLMINGRKMEFTVMRGMGAGSANVFLTFFLEQLFLCMGGGTSGVLILLLMGYGRIVWLAGAEFIVCYLAGCAVSILAVGRINLMELLSDRE